MATWIRILERIIVDVAIPIEALRIGRAGDNRIRLNEATQRAVVVTCIVEVQAYGRVFDLPCIAPRGGRGPGAETRSTPRMMRLQDRRPQFRNFATGAAGGERR